MRAAVAKGLGLALSLLVAHYSYAQARDLAPGERMLLRDDWALKSSVLVKEGGETVSTARFAPEGWHRIRVPCTVLSGLIKNGVYPDLRIGLNAMQIPDSSDEFNRKQDLAKYSHLPDGRNPWRDPYWYRTEFDLPETVRGKRVWLNFQAINYRADVWLNGAQVADRKRMVGALRRFRLDVTDQARPGRNCLAVMVHPVDHPGVPETQLDVLGKVRNYHTELMKDVTLAMFIGYDCMPTVPDRNMGLWQDVFVDVTEAVDIRDPFVVSELPLPETAPATLTVSAELVNASASPQKGMLRGAVAEDGVTFEKQVELRPGEVRTVTFSRNDGPQPVLPKPRLWWPSNYGPQNLYHLVLRFEVDGKTSDVAETTFGVRKITKELYQLDNEHGLRLGVNGRRIFVRGGYIQPEILFGWDARRIDAEIRYFTRANLNHVYFEDIANPPDELLDACDRYGLLFGNCYYGCYWMTPGSGNPDDLGLLAQCTEDLVKRYRNHPSMWLYMAMNEGDTRREVYEMWRKCVVDLDGTRIHIPSGSFPDYRDNPPAWIKPDMPVGMNDWVRGKSYGWQEPSQYYRWVRDERGWMFQMECGSASLPPVDSLRRFIPNLWDARPGGQFPLTSAWAHHGANSYFRPYDSALRRLHGEPESVEDYCLKGHLITADQHRAMFEAVNHRMWDVTSGLTQWKINACWPSVQWQIFDWFLRPMVSYYYIKKACQPVHVQLSPLDSTVTVVNHRLQPLEGLKVVARAFDFDMELRWEKRATVGLGANTYKEVFAIPAIADLTPVYFVKLELTDGGRTVADNFYWLSSRSPAEFTALGTLPLVKLNATCQAERQGEHCIVRAKVENATDKLAFFVHLAATKGEQGDEALPVLWDDNYFSLLPGESKEVRAILDAADLGSATPTLEVGGWNVRSPFQCIGLKVSHSRVRAGEPLTITASVARTFLDGSLIELLVDGKPVQAKRRYARGDLIREAVFTLRLTERGRHEIQIGDQKASVQVE
jgi:hypothetical protein